MTYPYERRRQRGGRPRKGKPLRTDTVKHRIALTDDLYALIAVERQEGETWNDVILRIFKERTQQIATLQKKLDAYLPRQPKVKASTNDCQISEFIYEKEILL